MSSTVASPHRSGELPRWLAGVAVSWSLVAGVGLLASGAAVWTSRSVRANEQQLLLGLADIGARSAARETASLLAELRRSVALFADDRADLLLSLLKSPGDALRQRQLQADLLRIFPDHVAHSLVRPDGSLVIDDFGETVGRLCLADIAVFLAHGHPEVVMHLGPAQFHFDLMVPWQTPQGMGVFFVSFRPDRLVRLLAQASGDDHRLWLLNRQLPALVKVTAEGARDVLQGDHMLAPGMLEHLQQLGARVPVAGTRWDMVALPTAGAVSSWSGHSQLRLSGALLTIWLFTGTVMWVLALHARRRQQLDQQKSLWSAVFNSAQEGIAITDARGRYLAVNESFTRITEYTQAEVLGRTPGLLASGRHDEAFYRDMWRSLAETGQWQGEIWNRRKGGEVYLEWLSISTECDDEGLPRHHIAVYIDFNRIRHAQTQLEHLAHHDALTDLPNRLLMRSRLQHALDRARRNQTQVAVLYMDLDGFKAVNDLHGHRAGDRVLREVARRLGARLRGADTIARLGGDEFVVVLEETDARPSAMDVARVVVEQVEQPIDIGNGLSVTVGASIGVGIYPLHATQMDRLLERADAAMYAAKEQGVGVVLALQVDGAQSPYDAIPGSPPL